MAMIASQVFIFPVYAIELDGVDVQAVSDVSWCGNIPGFGTYPQRSLKTITLDYKDKIRTQLDKESYTVVDELYQDDGSANNGELSIENVQVDGSKVTLSVNTNSSAGVLTAPGGNFRRYVSEFEIEHNEDIKNDSETVIATEGSTISFNQDDIINPASDEFKDYIVQSQNSDNNIYVKYYLPENYDETKDYPMVVHSTGGSQQYNSNTQFDKTVYGEDNFGVELDIDLVPKTFSIEAPEDTIFVSIQCLSSVGQELPEGYSAGKDINQIVHYFINQYSVDEDRVYAIGNSYGGIIMSEAVTLEPDLYTAFLPCNSSIGEPYYTQPNVDNPLTTDETYQNILNDCQIIAENKIKVYFHIGRNDHDVNTHCYNYESDLIAVNILEDLYREQGLSDEQISELVKIHVYENEDFQNVGSTYYHGATGLMCLNDDAVSWVYQQLKTNQENNTKEKASYDKAISSVIIPRYEADGSKTEQKVSEYLKAHLDTTDLTATVDKSNQTLTVAVQLKDVYLASDYLNGKSAAGESYYNMMNYYTDVLQIQQLLEKYTGYDVVDNKGNKVNSAYIDEFAGLLKQINNFDPTTNLKYDYTKNNGSDVIATSKDGNVTLTFHIDSHGWWGYDLGAHDSITGLVMGLSDEEAQEKQHEYTLKYGHFFVIQMDNQGPGQLYMLRSTDLENPMIYVSEDGKEAFMIDVDMYGSYALNNVIKSVIGDKCESLKIFLTHNHGDHVNNLAMIAQDDRLSQITTLIWPENEPHTVLTEKDTVADNMVGQDLVGLFDVQIIGDMEKISVAGNEFQFIEIPDEHTPGGGQLADLTNSILYSGDTLGAQVHLGGTTVSLSSLQGWIDGVQKSVNYIKDNGITGIIGGHTPYVNTPDFAVMGINSFRICTRSSSAR